MIQINNLSQFKKALKVGQMVKTVNHRYGDMGTRPISIVQSNSFAMKTTKESGEIVDSWCEYPKASEIECNGTNEVSIFWDVRGQREKILTYTLIEE